VPVRDVWKGKGRGSRGPEAYLNKLLVVVDVLLEFFAIHLSI
jgi:hypothetical protein